MTSPIPHHVNPTTPATTAMAPYNFVPLPQAIFTVEDGIDVAGQKVKPWECHDQFVPGTHSGWLDLSINALTPIFIRGAGRQHSDGKWDDSDQTRLRAAPFLDHLDRPTIPGSSLRGMIRNLIEILSFSKIQPVSNKQPFFRSMSANSRISDAYRERFITDLGDLSSGIDIATSSPVSQRAPGYEACVRAGIVRINGSHRVIEECGFARAERESIEQAFGKPALISRRQTKVPNWDVQHRSVYVQADSQPRDYLFRQQESRPGKVRHRDLYIRFRRVNQIATHAAAGLSQGVVVITGDMKYKHLEFVFLTGESLGRVEVPNVVWDRFRDGDQMTPWQEVAFERGQPPGSERLRHGHLRDGEPVFFLCDPNEVTEENPQGLVFGRAQMFRFPYHESPASLVPESLRDAGLGLDLAEAMFGCVPQRRHEPKQTQQEQQQAIKGRVFFEDCVVTEPGQWLAPEMVPQILGSPKVTAYQQYLTQNGKADARQHTTYIKGDTTTIRGHKLYWHRWDESRALDQVKNQNSKVSPTQTTLIQPVAETNTVGQPTIFSGRIRFENLTDIELGALLSTLNLPEECAHKIGMAKPLGLGSIRVTATLQLVDHTSRYQSWGNTGVTDNDGSKFIAAFKNAIEQHATESNEPRVSTQTGLRKIARLDALYLMLDYSGRPDRRSTEYLSLEQFKSRQVLPTPHQIRGQQTPDWPGPVPTPTREIPALQSQRHPLPNKNQRMPSVSSNAPMRTVRPSGKPEKLVKGDLCQVTVDRKKGKKLEVHAELANGDWNCGYLSNPEDVPDALQTKDTILPAVFEQRAGVNAVYRYVKEA